MEIPLLLRLLLVEPREGRKVFRRSRMPGAWLRTFSGVRGTGSSRIRKDDGGGGGVSWRVGMGMESGEVGGVVVAVVMGEARVEARGTEGALVVVGLSAEVEV
jgi:hypothetical protein